jgi:hypothetical protein
MVVVNEKSGETGYTISDEEVMEKIGQRKELKLFEEINGSKFSAVGYVLLDPYLEKTNEKYKSDYYEFFTLVVKGQYVKEIIEILKKIGYKSKYPGSMTLVVRVKAGHVGCFPVRNLQQEIIETTGKDTGPTF